MTFHSDDPFGPDLQSLEDEEIARNLALDEHRQRDLKFSLPIGSVALVQLSNVATNLQIGEVLLARMVDNHTIVFCLSVERDKFLTINSDGEVEYSAQQTNDAVFQVSNSPRGFLFLKCSGRSTRAYLGMTIAGNLTSQMSNDQFAEWKLVSAAVAINNVSATLAPTPIESAVNPLFSRSASKDNAVLSRTHSNVDQSRQIPSESYPPALPFVPMQQQSIQQTNKQRRAQALTPSQTTTSAAVDLTDFPGYAAGRQPLWSYFCTDRGFALLQTPAFESAFQLYLKNGALAELLHRPDWLLVSSRYKSYLHDTVRSMNDYDRQWFQQQPHMLQQIFEHGYTIVPNCVTTSKVHAARKVVNFWLHKHMSQQPPSPATPRQPVASECVNGVVRGRFSSVYSVGDIAQDVDILALYYDSMLAVLMQYYLGCDEVRHPRRAEIVSHFPILDVTIESPALYGDQWTIEGFTAAGDHSPYNLLVGIALTDMSQEDCGNLCLHPDSHILLMEQYCDNVRRCNTSFSDDPLKVNRPNLGPPTQICLRAGDAVICTHRVARLFAANYQADVSTMVFFRVSHIDHEQLKGPALESLWLEYPLASRVTEAAATIAQSQVQADVPVVAAFPIAAVTTDSDNWSTSEVWPVQQTMKQQSAWDPFACPPAGTFDHHDDVKGSGRNDVVHSDSTIPPAPVLLSPLIVSPVSAAISSTGAPVSDNQTTAMRPAPEVDQWSAFDSLLLDLPDAPSGDVVHARSEDIQQPALSTG